MALINRMSRLFTADMHAVLDRIEEPDVLLQARRPRDGRGARAQRAARGALEHERGALANRNAKSRRRRSPSSSEQVDVASRPATRSSRARSSSAGSRPSASSSTSSERRAALERSRSRTRRAALAEQREQLDVMRQKGELLANRPSREPATNGARRSSPSPRTRSRSRSCARSSGGRSHERPSNQTSFAHGIVAAASCSAPAAQPCSPR